MATLADPHVSPDTCAVRPHSEKQRGGGQGPLHIQTGSWDFPWGGELWGDLAGGLDLNAGALHVLDKDGVLVFVLEKATASWATTVFEISSGKSRPGKNPRWWREETLTRPPAMRSGGWKCVPCSGAVGGSKGRNLTG